MMRVTGLFVTVLIRSRMVGPKPGSFVSTSVTPASVMNTATLPPLNAAVSPAPEPVMMYRLSLTFSICMALIDAADSPGAWPDTTIERAATPISVPSTSPRLMALPFLGPYVITASIPHGTH